MLGFAITKPNQQKRAIANFVETALKSSESECRTDDERAMSALPSAIANLVETVLKGMRKQV